jgi:orotidine-5'-phosphate decarboxylase
VAPNFGDRLAEAVLERRSQLVLGLDPDPARLWPRAIELAGGAGSPPAPPEARASLAVSIHCALVLDAVGEECVAVKPQVACFERLGASGWAALSEVIARARERGLLVIADAKRGDIDVTATAYAQAFFGETPTPYGAVQGLGADALTVNPLLGGDSVRPFLDAARARQSGLFMLVRTSNPGAADVQELVLEDGGSVSRRLADLVSQLGETGAAGIADVGAVVGATAPERLEYLRSAMPHAPFLLPGVGAQGGRVEDLIAAFAPGAAGGLVSASRGIVAAHEKLGGEPAAAAHAEAARLRQLAWELAG